MIKLLKADIDEPERYQDDATGQVYSRVVGGLAWPVQEKPGFLVVLAKEFTKDSSGHHHYWRLAEHEDSDMGNLIRRAMDMRQQFLTREWVGNAGNKPAMYLLGELMQRYPVNERLSLDMAPHAADAHGLSYYLPLIKEHIGTRKLLHFGQSDIPAYIGQIKTDDLTRSPGDFPAVAALGYALSELYGYQVGIALHQPVSYSDRPGAWML